MMLRKIFVVACLAMFSVGATVGCAPPAGDDAPPASTATADEAPAAEEDADDAAPAAEEAAE